MSMLDEYDKQLTEELELPALERGGVQVVFRPSFHVECAISLLPPRLDFRTLSSSLWHYVSAFGAEPDKTLRELISERDPHIQVTKPYLVTAQHNLKASRVKPVLDLLPAAPVDEPGGGVTIDGMRVRIDTHHLDGPTRLWDGVPVSEDHTGFEVKPFLRSVVEIALEGVDMPLGVVRLESLQRYLTDDLPVVRDRGREPRIVEVMGRPRHHRDELVEFFDGVDEDELIVDLTAPRLFPAEPTLLLRMMGKFETRLAVVTEPWTARALHEAGFDAVFPTVGSARRAICGAG